MHTVYLLKMSSGLDQYLANRLTADHVFQVVTDPKLADAVFTDQIGEGFQMKLDEIVPHRRRDRQAGRAPPKTETRPADQMQPVAGRHREQAVESGNAVRRSAAPGAPSFWWTPSRGR